MLDELSALSLPDVQPLLSVAKQSLRPLVSGPRCFVPTTGQLMGNLLSFPLLCLQNWCAATWVDRMMGLDTPKLINGDDLLVQADDDWTSLYRLVVPGLGMMLNERKTAFSRKLLTMNSTYYTGNFKKIPFVKMRIHQSDVRELPEVLHALSSEFTRSPLRARLTRHLLSFWSFKIRGSRRSLYKLGFRLPLLGHHQIPKPLWRREKCRTGHEYDIPKRPAGFHQSMMACPEAKEFLEDKEIAECVVEATWKMGGYERPARQSLRDVRLALKASPSKRGPERSQVARQRLYEWPEKKSPAIPESIVDCFLGIHTTVSIRDGYLEWGECDLCTKLRERWWKKENEGMRSVTDLKVPPRAPDVTWT